MREGQRMSKIKKKLCKLKKEDIKKMEDEILKQVSKPKYMCAKCARVCRDKDLLCEPDKIKL